MSFVDKMKAHWEKAGASYLGSILNWSVSINPDAPVHFDDFVKALKDSGVEDEWLPESMDVVSVYQQTISRLGQSAIRHFEIPSGINFDPASHGSYIVKKQYAKSDPNKKIQAIHQVSWMEKDFTDFETIADGEVNDVREFISHDPINVYLLNDNSIRVKIPNNPGGGVPEFYMPFLKTLKSQFNDKIQLYYGTDQITRFLRDLILNKIGVDKIGRNLFFIHHSRMELIASLSENLVKLNSGIKIFTVPVPFFENDTENVMGHSHQMVQASMYDSLMTELDSVIDQLNSMTEKKKENGDGKYGVRDETWTNRIIDLQALESKARQYLSEHLLQQESLEFLLEELAEGMQLAIGGLKA